MSEALFPAESWTDGVEQPDVIVNDNARRLEVAVLPAISFESAEPGSPTDGDLHVLTAAWGEGVEHDLAYYFDGAWTFWTPFEGQIKDIGGSPYRVESGAWAIYAAGSFAPVAIQFVADLGSTADSDPGAGLLKWNHATQASATQIYLDDDTADGASLTGLWAALSAGGFMYLQHATDPDVWQIWDVTAVVDATGYAKLSVALLAKSAGNFADADPMLVTIDQGAASSAVADGDYGDITVSGSGATWTLDTTQAGAHTWAATQTFSVAPVFTDAAGTNTALGLGATDTVTFRGVRLDNPTVASRPITWRTNGVNRWQATANGTAEGGANAGSDWALVAYDDAGASLGNAIEVTRATRLVNFPVSPTVPTPTAGDDTTKGASTAFVWGAAATIRQNSQSAAYTLVAADAGKHIYHPSTDANARTFTIPANASVAYPIGTALTFVNETSQVVTIAITTDTLVLAGSGSTGSRSLAQYGVATAMKVTSTRWIISGTGLT